MHNFKVNDVLRINGKDFTITKAEPLDAIPGTQKLTGTFHADPTFLAGKRTIFTHYLRVSKTTYLYDYAAN